MRACVAAAALLAAGCGSGLYPVSGRVTIDGKPAARVMVRFVPAPGGPPRPAFGETDADGRYRLTTYELNDGVLPGDYLVVVAGRDNTMESIGPPGDDAETNAKIMAEYRRRYEEFKRRAPKKGELPVAVADTTTTPLRWSVPRDGRVADFALDSGAAK